MNLTVTSARRLRGETRVPGDKSITHRAIMLAALADAPCRINGYLDGGDCRATLGVIQSLGAEIATVGEGAIVVRGRGLRALQEPGDVLDCVRSGTTMRLMAGLLAGLPMFSVLSGDSQLTRRPMGRIVEPLTEMGAQIAGRKGGRLAPLAIRGGGLHGIDYALPVASAQVKSSILLAGLSAQGATIVREPGPSRDHTERMLRARGVAVKSDGLDHRLVGPVDAIAAVDTAVPGDFSSASYIVAAALLVPGSLVTIRGVSVNRTRTGLLDVLRSMGADILVENLHDAGGEPIADLIVSTSGLRATAADGEVVPRMIDEFPILALLATQAQGVTHIRDAAELRVKETDRIETVVAALRALGAHIEGTPDGMVIEGPTPLTGAQIDSGGDHRLAMMAVVAGLIARGETLVTQVECISDSFPGFMPLLQGLMEGDA